MAGDRANIRYFFWILGCAQPASGAGYFVFSGIFGFGDWYAVIRDLSPQVAWRIGIQCSELDCISWRMAAGRLYPPILAGQTDVQHRGAAAVLHCLPIQLVRPVR